MPPSNSLDSRSKLRQQMHPQTSPSPLEGPPDTLTVSQLNHMARQVLESHFDFVWIEGEISNLATPGSGHWYFSLKDENAQVRCAMFRNRNARVRFRPENGQHLRLRARVSLYEGRGEFQLIVEYMEDAGAGALQRAFDALKAKLQGEGLFDAERKRALPAYPGRIAIVSSRSGAALRDIITVFNRRFPGIYLGLFPVTVQGETAAKEMCDALASMSACGDFDAVIVTRGGGSAEDLWAFNDENLARAIAACPIPVVSAVGHEIDFTIADFVADQRAPTPSAAAELLSPDQRELAATLLALEHDLSRRFRRRLAMHASELKALRRQLRHPGDHLREQAQRLDELELRLQRSWQLGLTHRKHRLATARSRLGHASPGLALSRYRQSLAYVAGRAQVAAEQGLARARHGLALGSGRLNALSPLNTLERGFALVTDSSGDLITRPEAVKVGDRIITRFSHGTLASDVREINPEGSPTESGEQPDGKD
jgi:exodeoxyribonuclease VII large subunit